MRVQTPLVIATAATLEAASAARRSDSDRVIFERDQFHVVNAAMFERWQQHPGRLLPPITHSH